MAIDDQREKQGIVGGGPSSEIEANVLQLQGV